MQYRWYKKENDEKIAESFSNENKFLDNLKKSIKDNKKFVLVCSNPENIEQNSKYLELDITALNMSGIFFDEYVALDNRNKKNVNEIIKDILLSTFLLCLDVIVFIKQLSRKMRLIYNKNTMQNANYML